ncbi:hypothetical protein [Paenibacillus azoreducens]|uniref:Uncharacterized protein n=1 Tax=Paenibacillus azoreducens TaxID=116718 RepID=A0A920CNZ1_9BACL|nr:hypothetical protein [Paenibacillus azoreducens]GIO48026.1 hypothetical protein J34TS1_27910 [Paenibacillus azoreducens]
MEQSLHEIKAIKETRDPEEVNKLLKEGWVIDFRQHEPSRSRYVLIKF